MVNFQSPKGRITLTVVSDTIFENTMEDIYPLDALACLNSATLDVLEILYGNASKDKIPVHLSLMRSLAKEQAALISTIMSAIRTD